MTMAYKVIKVTRMRYIPHRYMGRSIVDEGKRWNV